MALKKLYPPEIEGIIPAFCGTVLTVPFSMNKTVSKSEVSGMILKIKTVYSNQYLGAAKTYFNGSTQEIWDRVDFDLSGIIDKLNISQYYKIQIAYLSSDGSKEVIGYYSTIGVVKYTAFPSSEINNLEMGKINSHYYNYLGVYHIPQYTIDGNTYYDINEKEYSYHFNIYDDEGNIYYTTDEIIHNGINDNTDELYEQFDNFEYLNDLPQNQTFYIQYIVTTTNKMIVQSPKYRIVQRVSIDPELKAIVNTKLNFDNGYIDVSLIGEKDKKSGIEIAASGSFKLMRSDNQSNFTSWKEILKFALYGQQPSTWNWRDCTIEQGIEYIYAIQQYNDNGLISNRIESEKIYADFEDAFLYDGDKQLKIRFNPKISSFKTDLLETKVDTIGSKFPFIFRNGNVSYKEFPISGLISYQMDEEKLFMNYNNLEYLSNNLVGENLSLERIFKIAVLDWLNNGKPKLFRSPAEGNYIVRLINTSLSPNDTLGRMLHTFSSTAYEIADFSYENLSKYGIINVVDPIQTQTRWETVNFEESAGLNNENYNWLLHYPATSLRFEGMAPGDKIKLDDGVQRIDGSGFIVTIGMTGSYMVDNGIKIYSVKFLDQADSDELRLHQGSLTYSYESKSVNKFDTISDFLINDIPARQFIGQHEILDEITNAKDQISKIFFLHSSARQIQQVVFKNNNYYIDNNVLIPDIFHLYEVYSENNSIGYYLIWEVVKDINGNPQLDPSIGATGYLYHYVIIYPSNLNNYSSYKRYEKNIIENDGRYYYEDSKVLLHPETNILYPVITKNPISYLEYKEDMGYKQITLDNIFGKRVDGTYDYNNKICNNIIIYYNVNGSIESQEISLNNIESYELSNLDNIVEIVQNYGIISEISYQQKTVEYAIEKTNDPDYDYLIQAKENYNKKLSIYENIYESGPNNWTDWTEDQWNDWEKELTKAEQEKNNAYEKYLQALDKALKQYEEANN